MRHVPRCALTLRSTGRAGTCLLVRKHRRGAPVTLHVRPHAPTREHLRLRGTGCVVVVGPSRASRIHAFGGVIWPLQLLGDGRLFSSIRTQRCSNAARGGDIPNQGSTHAGVDPAVLPQSHSTARPGYVVPPSLAGSGRAVLVPFPPFIQRRRAGALADTGADIVAPSATSMAESHARAPGLLQHLATPRYRRAHSLRRHSQHARCLRSSSCRLLPRSA